jgi:hypothetical protein
MRHRSVQPSVNSAVLPRPRGGSNPRPSQKSFNDNLFDGLSIIVRVRTVDHAQKMSMLKVPLHAHGFTTSTYAPMECLNVDFVSPFQDGGYIFVIVDTFTR